MAAVLQRSGRVSRSPGRVSGCLGRGPGSPGHVSRSLGRVSGFLGRVSRSPGHVSGSLERVSRSPGRVSSSPGRVSGSPGRVSISVLFCVLLLLLTTASSSSAGRTQTGPRLLLSHTELRQRNSSAVFWDGVVGGGYQALLLDEDRGWLLVGGRDHVYLFLSDHLEKPAHTIYWPAAPEHVDHCRLAGKSLLTDCANYVRLLQPFNKTHVYVCGTGAYHPQCTFIHLGHSAEKPSFQLLTHAVESGRGKCPFSPREPFTARITDGDLYAGTSVDFMGANAAIFRTPVQDNSQHYLRTEAYQDHWLNEPEFVGSFSIPDTHSADDDKVYFFFKETAVEAGQWDKRVYSRVARVCKNDMGGKRSLINRWSTFLKARLVCSVPGPAGLDTPFDELEDIFVLETKDPQNPVIYGVFSTSSSVFRGSAVCVYSMSSIRAAFNGPFAHKEGPDYRWVEYRGRIPYPRPGTCPSETYDPLHKSTRDFPDELVSFMRGHQLMWEPVLPLGRRPTFTRVSAPQVLKRVVVDRVEAEDGQYDVLHLGTDDGKVLKVVSIAQADGGTEEIILEELTVFQNPTPILSMEMSTKRQQLYVSGDGGVVQLALQRCDLHGKDCPACCLARDPYCAWDGHSCSTYFHTSKRRARRQDVKYGDPTSQCHDIGDGSKSVEVKLIYGVESNSTFLECLPRPQQASVTWTVQQGHTSRELVQADERMVRTARGLLIQDLLPGDAGVYTCVVREHGYSRGFARYSLQVIPRHHLTSLGGPGASGGSLRPRHPGGGGLPAQLLQKNYKELQLEGAAGLTLDQYCEQLWYREKRRQQKLLKWKQEAESRKARVRRHHPPLPPYDGPPQ